MIQDGGERADLVAPEMFAPPVGWEHPTIAKRQNSAIKLFIYHSFIYLRPKTFLSS
jgi:hypothetical protein